MSPWRMRNDWLRLGALALSAVAIWLIATGNWTAAAWRTPASYSVDALETLARFQISHEQGASLLWQPGAARLGAPGGADWAGYPLPDFPWYWLAGKLVGLLGLIPASNAMLLLAHVAAVLSFFFCARIVGQRPLFAAGAALLFGFSFSVFHRGLSHHSFALVFTVPLAWVTVWLVAGSRRLIAQRRGQALCLTSGFLIGWSNPYFIYLFGVLLLLALGAQLLRARRATNLVVGLLTGALCLGTFVLANLPFLRASATALYARSAQQAELYGLRLADLWTPSPNHRLSFAAEWGRASAEGRTGELFAPYLGVIGLAGVALIVLVSFVRLARRQKPSATAGWLAFLLAFAISGGIATWLAHAGLDQFRATNRYSIHLLALALFFLSHWAMLATRRWPRSAARLLVAGVVLFGCYDSIPRAASPEHRSELAAAVMSDRALGTQLEAALPAGAQIFQIPSAAFPEQGTLGRMTDYALLRPLLATHTLRFSYGDLRTAEDQTWKRNVAALPTPQLLEALERAGFSALHLNRAALADRASDLEREITVQGRPLLASSGDDLVFRLKPAERPITPGPSDRLFFARWDEATSVTHAVAAFVDASWFPLEREGARSWRWAPSQATLPLFNSSSSIRRVILRAEITATSSAPFLFALGQQTERFDLRAFEAYKIEVSLPLAPGLNHVRLTLEAPARRAGPGDARLIAFNLANLTIESPATASP